MPLVSVLIPACDAAPTIAGAVASVLAQTMADWELVIGADDDLDYLAVLAGRGIVDRRIRQSRTAARASGPSAARNAALAVASGAVIAHLDADDAFEPERLAALAPQARAVGIASCNVQVVGPTGRPLKRAHGARAAPFMLDADAVMDCGVPILPVVRRDLIGAGWPETVRFAEDVLFNLELLSRNGGRHVAHPAPLYRYCVREGSASHSAEAAEAGYAAILAGLAAGRFDLTDERREAAIAGFTRKRAVNAGFAAAFAAGRFATFQEYLAAQPQTAGA